MYANLAKLRTYTGNFEDLALVFQVRASVTLDLVAGRVQRVSWTVGHTRTGPQDHVSLSNALLDVTV